MSAYKTIFLVDDDEDDRMLVREAIEGAVNPINIIEVENADELTHFLEKVPKGPKLILMDMNMPRVNGLEMLSRLKSDTRYHHIPVIMISTNSNQKMINRAYSLGVSAYIIKPILQKDYDLLAQGVALCFLNNYRWAARMSAPEIRGSKTIIVIEDNDDHWFLFESAIRNSKMQYNLLRLKTKERAVAFALQELAGFQPQIDMILIDLYLPERSDGLELLSKIRDSMQQHQLENIPLVMFTYSDRDEDVDACYREQANAYLVKPLEMEGWRFYFENVLHFWSAAVKRSAFHES